MSPGCELQVPPARTQATGAALSPPWKGWQRHDKGPRLSILCLSQALADKSVSIFDLEWWFGLKALPPFIAIPGYLKRNSNSPLGWG